MPSAVMSGAVARSRRCRDWPADRRLRPARRYNRNVVHAGGNTMKMTLRASAVLLLSVLAVSGAWAQTDSDRTVTAAQYEQWKMELTNWGRWGADDEIGALNLITPGQAAGGGGPGRGGLHGIPGRRCRHRGGGRQSVSLRARDGGDQLGPHLRPLSRHLPYAPGRSGPHQRRRRLLQRLRAGRRRGHRERAPEELHPQPEERHRDTRRAHRHPAAAGRAVTWSPGRRSTWRIWRRGRSRRA